jgi:hypothetical protein
MSETETAIAGSALESLERLLTEMRGAGVTHPASVVRAGLDAGEVIWRAPLFAWGAGINPVTLLWASEIQGVMVCANALRDMPATTRALGLALDVAGLAAP